MAEYIVSSGEVSSGIILNSYEKMTVLDGGTADSTLVNLMGSMNVSSGGTVNHVVVNDNGRLTVSSGGTVLNIRENGGYVSAADGAEVSFVSNTFSGLFFYNRVSIHSGTTAVDIMGSNYLSCFSGGKLTGRIVLPRMGNASFESGAVIDFDLTRTMPGAAARMVNYEKLRGTPNYTITVDANQAEGIYILVDNAEGFDQTLTIMNPAGAELGTVSVGETVMISDVAYVLNLADNALTLKIGETITPSPYTSDGLVLSRSINTKEVLSGEVYHDTIVDFLAKLHVSSGGTAEGTRLVNMGKLYVSCGGTASNTTVYSRGEMHVESCGSANGITLDYLGRLWVSSGGFADNITFNYGGCLTVYSGGTALNIRENGFVKVEDGAKVTFLSNTLSGLYYGEDEGGAAIHSGTTAISTTFPSGSFTVFDGGVAIDTETNDGWLRVSSGGVAINTIIGADPKRRGGYFTVFPGAYANNTTINNGGVIAVYSGGTADNTTVNSRSEFYVRGGTANNVTVNSLGCVFIEEGTANHVVVNDNGRLTVNRGCTVNHVVVNAGGHLTVSNGGTAMEIDWTPCNGYLSLDKNATVTFASQYSGVYYGSGGQLLSHGSKIDSISLDSASEMFVMFGGTAADTMIDSGGKMMISGGTAAGTTVGSGGSLCVSSGGTATEVAALDGAYFYFDVSSDTYISGTVGASVFEIKDGFVSGYAFPGELRLLSGGSATSTTLNAEGRLWINSDGSANSTTVNSNGRLYANGGTANLTTVNSGGTLQVSAGGTANNVTVNSGGTLQVSAGGTANSAVGEKGAYFRIGSGGMANNLVAQEGVFLGLEVSSDTYISGTSGGSAFEIKDRYVSGFVIDSRCDLLVCEESKADGTVISGGSMTVSSGTANDTTVVSGSLLIANGGIANNVVVDAGSLRVYIRGTVKDLTVASGAELSVDYSYASISGAIINLSSGKLTGRMVFAEGAIISANMASLDFDISDLAPDTDPLVNNWSIIQGTPVCTLTTNMDLKAGCYVYSLAGGAAGFNSAVTVVNKAGEKLGNLALGETVKIGYDDYTLNLTDSLLSVTVNVPDLTPTDTISTAEQVSWKATGANRYIVNYSTDNFEHAIQVITTGDAIDSPELPAGTYQWRVSADANSEWKVGETIVSENETAEPKVVQSNEDGNDDLFFASPCETWESFYYARHVGSINDWAGTNEYASVSGKNKLADIIEGSTDASILLMTDDDNGDALFVDDIYSALPGSVSEQQSRIAQIDEIRAGFGNDIVDMTSQRFEYIGEGLTIRGGEGNDTIWANKGDNFLFGDAGNDRIVGASGNDVIAGGIGNDRLHGGGGEDVFTFCDNWGSDNVEQLPGGSVTLWFASGSMENWNASTLTYMDGDYSVKVSGVIAEQVKLKFGDDGSTQFATLSGMGAFNSFTSQRIFEESGKGILASP